MAGLPLVESMQNDTFVCHMRNTMDRLDDRVIFSLSTADKDRLRRLAEAEGRPLSNEVRRLVLIELTRKGRKVVGRRLLTEG